MIALLAPGQGAQSPGMLAPWLALEGAQARVATWSTATGLDLARLGTTADTEEIKDTAVTQPLVVALSLLAAEELARRIDLPADAPIAGHPVGELAAAAIAGVLTADEAVPLAAVRGREMAAACALEPTGMSAALGGDPDEITPVLTRLGLGTANRNGAGQVVAGGAACADAGRALGWPTCLPNGTASMRSMILLCALVDVGESPAAARLARLFAEPGRIDQFRTRANASHGWAGSRLTDLLVEHGRIDEAMTLLRALADEGDQWAAERLASFLTTWERGASGSERFSSGADTADSP